MRVVITDAALSDVAEIGDYIALDNPRRAQSFVAELLLACESLADHAARFPLVPRFEQTGIRRRVHGNYLIFYRIKTDEVEITHVLSSATDYETTLFPDA